MIGRLLPDRGGGRLLCFGLSAGVPFDSGLNPSGLDTGGLVLQVNRLSGREAMGMGPVRAVREDW